MGLKSVVSLGIVAAMSLGVPAFAQYQVLDDGDRSAPADETTTSSDYVWSIAVDGGEVTMSGQVPYESVGNLLSRRAGITAQLDVQPDAPLGFLRDALLAIEAVGYLETGEAAYRDGAWTLTGTVLPDEQTSDLTTLLGNATGAGPDWVLNLDETPETADIVDPSPLPEPETSRLANRVDAALADTPSSENPAPDPIFVDVPEETPVARAPQTAAEPELIEIEPVAPPEPTEPDTAPADIEAAEALPEPETTDPAAVEMCEEQVADLLESRSVLFASGRSTITSDSQSLLSDLADVFAICPQAPIYVEGHTDTDGGEEANLTLSLSRAESVVDALVGLGVRPGRLYAVGYGASLPIASNDTAAGKAQNRRIVFNFEDIAAQGGVER